MKRTFAWLTIIVMGALASLCGWLAVDGLRLDTTSEDLIAEDLPYRQHRRAFERSFPQAQAPLVAVVQGRTPERARWSAERLARRLDRRDDLFREAHQPRGGAFFDRHALLFLSVEELERVSSRLSAARPALSRLAADPTLPELSSLLIATLERSERTPSEALVPALERMRRTIPANEDEPIRELSWERMFLDHDEQGARVRVIQLWPAKRADGLAPTGEAIEGVREAARSLGLDRWNVSVRMTGSAALSHDELSTAIEGMRVAIPLSVVLVAALLLYAMRSHALLIASLLTLIVGLLLTAGFATLAVGRLNLISMAFGVLYVGLGADFAIHLSLNIRALRAEGLAPTRALRGAVRDVSGSLCLCALTTMVGFFAFLPTSFTAVSELGLIAGAGMIINLITTLTLLPALMTVLPSRWRRPSAPKTSPWLLRALHAPERHRAPVLALASAAALAGLAMTPNIQFDPDPLTLRDPESESVRALRHLREHHGSSQQSVSVVVGSADAAAQHSERLSESPRVDRAVWIKSFIPDRQAEKLAMIEDMSRLLGPAIEPAEEPETRAAEAEEREDANTPVEVERTLQRLNDLYVQLRRTASRPMVEPVMESAANGLAGTLRNWLDRVSESPRPQRELDRLERAWLGAFPLMFDRLRESLWPDGEVTLEALPDSLRRRWVSPEGLHRVEAFPRSDLTGQGEMLAFVEQARRVSPGVVGPPVSQVESGEVVVRSFLEALSLATTAIVLIALLYFRSAVTMLEVLAPLLIGGLATVGVMAFLDAPFNFANVIALPLLFGVGVDSGIHLVHRSKQGAYDRLLESATARGVLYSGLTTIAGFGSLAFSPHPGMASMGLVLSIGMIAILLSTLVALPALLTFRAPSRGDL